MTNTTSVLSILAWLGMAFFCGLLPLGFAAILFFTSRKREKIGSALGSAKKMTVAALHPDGHLVRLQGRIAPMANAIDGAADNALVYLRLKVEVYEYDSDGSGWKGMADKARGMPFQLEDGSGAVWINPDGLDKQLLGDGIVPDENQAQAACILLGISLPRFHGQLRFKLWELRAGQTVSVVGVPLQESVGLQVQHVQGQPFVISPLLGQFVDATVSSQTKKARTWTLVLGIPGAIMLVCGLGGALFSLVRMLIAN